MDKKILLIVVLGMMISIVGAFTFDDVMEYSDNDMKVTFNNCDFWLLTCLNGGELIGSAELKSHSFITEIKNFGFGKEEVVTYYDFTNWEFYENGLGDVKFIDMNTDKEIEKDYSFVIWTLENVVVNDYTEICSLNKINNSEECSLEISGTHLEEKGSWVEYKSLDIPAGNSRIGLKTYVGQNDYIDGVWTIVGKEVSKHITWVGDLDSGNVAYYSFEETSGVAVDRTGNYDGEVGVVTRGVNGKIDNAFKFSGHPVTTGYVNITNVNSLIGTDMSGSAWVNITSVNAGSVATIFWLKDDAPNAYSTIARSGVSNLAFNVYDGTDNAFTTDYSSYFNETTWLFWTYNSTSMQLYFNNVLVINEVADISIGFGGIDWMRIGNGDGNGRATDGMIDEVGVWNRTLSDEERDFLWNDGDGRAYGDDDILPVVTLESPNNFTNFTATNEVDFECLPVDYVNDIINVTLHIDDVLNETNTDGLNATTVSFNKFLSEGTHDWTCEVYSNISESFTAEKFLLNVSTSPQINYTAPTPANNFNVTAINEFQVNVSVTEILFKNITFDLYHKGGGLNSSTTYTNSTRIHNFISLPEADYSYNVTVATTTNQFNSTATRNITIHTSGPLVAITSPGAIVEFHEINTNLTINWTVEDASIDACTLEYKGVNITQICNNNGTEIKITDDINRTVIFYVNDTVGNENLTSSTWDYTLLELNQSFVNETIEGASNDFEINYSIISGSVISATILWYNGTPNLATRSDFGGGILGAIVGGIVAQQVASDSNISFHWSFIFSDGSQINTTSRNQTVLDLNIDDCSINTNLIYNYSIVDEETQLKIDNTSLELSINIFDLSREFSIINFSKDYGTTNPGLVCLNLSLTNETSYSLDSTLKYSSNASTGYAIEYYVLLNFTLSNSTVDPNVTLYDLNLNDSTDFQLTYKDENLAFDPDIRILVNRQYISEDIFKVVEIPITDSNGQTVLHLVRNNVVYNLLMVDIQGNVVATFNKVRAFCQDFTIGDCSLALNAERGVDTVINITDSVGIAYELSYLNSSSVLSLEFISNDLTPKKVSLEVIRNTDFGNRTVCLEDLTSSSGILTCNLTDVDERYLFLNILVDDEFIGTNTLDKGANSSGVYGTEGYFMAFLIILLLITMFSDQKQVLVFSLLIGWIAVISLSLISGGVFGLFSSGIWLIITIALYLWKLRGETS